MAERNGNFVFVVGEPLSWGQVKNWVISGFFNEAMRCLLTYLPSGNLKVATRPILEGIGTPPL